MSSEHGVTTPALRLFSVLELLSREDRAYTLTELMTALGQPKPTVHRMLQQLGAAGLVQREPDGKRYAVGWRMVRLAESVLLHAGRRTARHAILEQLVAEVGETCNFTMLSGTEVVYLDRVETAWPLRFYLQPGSRVPVHCSASGKVFLGWMPPSQRSRLLSRLVLTPFTPNTLTDLPRLKEQIERARTRGYAVDREEYLTGLVCVAVPVLEATAGRRCRGCVALQAPTSRLPLEAALRHLPALERAAAAMGRTLQPADMHPVPAPPRRPTSRSERIVHAS